MRGSARGFHTGGAVDAVAEDVAVTHLDVAQMETDAHLKAPLHRAMNSSRCRVRNSFARAPT
jgi:hypothetical protein